MLQYRHGDVGLVPVRVTKSELAQAKRLDRLVLAEGEATGHKHQVTEADIEGAELYQLGDRMILRVTAKGGVSITHPEHAAILVAPGAYEVRIAQEYDEERDFRKVVD